MKVIQSCIYYGQISFFIRSNRSLCRLLFKFEQYLFLRVHGHVVLFNSNSHNAIYYDRVHLTHYPEQICIWRRKSDLQAYCTGHREEFS